MLIWKKILLLIISVLISSCLIDKYQIKEGSRNPALLSDAQNNHKGHIFWEYLKDENGKCIIDSNKKLIFDRSRDSIIYVHGWQGVGLLGWTQHPFMLASGLLLGPISAIISMSYNVPTNGVEFPNFDKRLKEFNIGIFDWQVYNNIDDIYETSVNLSLLEKNIKNNPNDWPNLSKNLADEIKLFINSQNYKKNITLVAHSLGAQVILRAYNLLSDEVKDKIKAIVLIEPFTTNHYEYISKEKLNGSKPYWLTGLVSPWIKNDLSEAIEESGVMDKLYVIVSTDIGDSWIKNFAEPLNLNKDNILTDQFENENYQIDASYSNKVKKNHQKILDTFFYEEKYDEAIGLK